MFKQYKLESKRDLFDPDLLNNKSEAELWLLSLGVKNYSINSNGSIDVDKIYIYLIKVLKKSQ